MTPPHQNVQPSRPSHHLQSTCRCPNVIDVDKAKVKLQQRRSAIEKDIAKVEGQLNNPEFRTRAPQDKVKALVAQLSDLKGQLASVDAQLKVLDS